MKSSIARELACRIFVQLFEQSSQSIFRKNNVEKMKTGDGGDEVIEMQLQQTEDAVDAPRRDNKVINFYHTKKSAAEGMMDISLLTANANQLKFIIFYNQASVTFYPALSLIVLSLVLQVSIGFLLIFRRRFKSHGRKRYVSTVNEYLVLLIFLVTIINVLAAVLTTTETVTGA